MDMAAPVTAVMVVPMATDFVVMRVHVRRLVR
jgi:hypothetical protein